jgi:hypothetical protein
MSDGSKRCFLVCLSDIDRCIEDTYGHQPIAAKILYKHPDIDLCTHVYDPQPELELQQNDLPTQESRCKELDEKTRGDPNTIHWKVDQWMVLNLID